mmetsp:Transcript_6422/g.7450  ORF Transcript_6422/g.7450 Transcript_6422/m.7450 type:complete len:236 (+) Transcript_6422:750-1457(+)
MKEIEEMTRNKWIEVINVKATNEEGVIHTISWNCKLLIKLSTPEKAPEVPDVNINDQIRSLVACASSNGVYYKVTEYCCVGMELYCLLYDTVSDGKKHEWAAISFGVSQIDVYDINYGAVGGSFEPCMTPRDIKHHPHRDEKWFCCMAIEDESEGYMELFPAASPSANTVASVNLTGNNTWSANRYSMNDNTCIDNRTGDIDYAIVWNQHTLYKIKLNDHVVILEHSLRNEYGNY